MGIHCHGDLGIHYYNYDLQSLWMEPLQADIEAVVLSIFGWFLQHSR